MSNDSGIFLPFFRGRGWVFCVGSSVGSLAMTSDGGERTVSINGCLSKLSRAKEHRDAIETYITDTFAVESNRPRVGAKFEPETNSNVLYVSEMPDLTDFLNRVALMLGDAVHNLRSALDHLAYQLALLHTNGNIRNVRNIAFPITDTLEQFKIKRKRYLREVNPTQRAEIELLQPYHGLEGIPETGWSGPYVHPLALLRDLSDHDKHRLLIPTVAVPSNYSLSLTGAFVTLLSLFDDYATTHPGEPLKLGAILMRTPTIMGRLKRDMEMEGEITPSIRLSEGRPLVDTLDRIAAAVTNTLSRFEPLFQ